jgi:hypothetical protein
VRYLLQAFAAAALMAAPAEGQKRKLPIADECGRDTSFRGFRERLIRAASAKDVRDLLELTADDVKFSFGDDHGENGFKASWNLDRPASSQFWKELLSVLRLGCTMQGSHASAPYIFGRFPQALDPSNHVVAVHPRAVARAAPSVRSRVIANLDFDIVKLAGDDAGGSWVAVTLRGGRLAYIRRSQVRSPLDYRALFEKIEGRWLMTMFIAGD